MQNDVIDAFRFTAAQGDTLAQLYLGKMYFSGEGGSRDYAEAAKWFRLAAEQGDTIAQSFLGVCRIRNSARVRDKDS